MKTSKKILMSIAIPVAFYIILQLLVLPVNRVSILTATNYIMFIRTLTTTVLLALGLACNIVCGRFDFSLGAVRLAACIIGGNIAIQLGLNGVMVMLFAIVLGFVLSAIVGLVYCVTQISPIVIGLIMCLLYESLGLLVFDSEGLNLLKASGDMSMLSNPVFLVVAMLLAVLVVNFLSVNTSYGYHARALGSGQFVAVNAGINEKVNTVICYGISGALFSMAGVVSASYQGIMSPTLALGSVSAVFTAMLPVFVGGFMARYSTDTIGTFIACIMVSCMNMSFTAFGFSDSQKNLISAIILILFLMFSGNLSKIAAHKTLKARKAEAISLQK